MHQPTHTISPGRIPPVAIDLLGKFDLPPELSRTASYSVAVAQQLAAWGAGADLCSAGLLHEFVYLERLPVEQVRAGCGQHTAFLCAAYCRTLTELTAPAWAGRSFILPRIQIYTAAYCHPELALLCVAHLWISAVQVDDVSASINPPQRSLLVARKELANVLAPLLDMLGMRALREELDTHLSPLSVDELAQQRTANRQLFEQIRTQLSNVTPHARLLYNERGWSSEKNHERQTGQQSLSVRMVVDSEEECYHALHRLHRLYQPIDGALIDTIHASRGNGHRSLQTSVSATIAGRATKLTVQIATPLMDLVNRWGVAAFYLRQDGWSQATLAESAAPAYAAAWWNDAANRYAAITSAPLGSSTAQTVHVFSPQGELFTFDRGSTVVDYAYHVHSDLAEQCQRFYVNGETVEPATVLRHLDLVELEQTPRAPGPTVAWLNAARTKRARTRIRRFLRNQGQGINDGRRIVDARLQVLEEHYGFHVADHRVDAAIARAARYMRLASSDDLLAELAAGRLVADRFLHPLFAEEIVRRIELPRGLRLRPHQIVLAQCCRPRPGDDVIGHPHRREGIITKLTVHRNDCTRYRGADADKHTESIPLRWRLQRLTRTLAQIEVTARDDDGLLGEALAQIYARLPRVLLLRSEAHARRGAARLRFNIEADSQETLDEIADALRRLPNREVSSVRQLTLPPSEQDALLADSAGVSNPYSRLPVHDPTMFFGRSIELARIDDWMRNNVSCIWLRGQKRVGKTSLLLQLQRHLEESHEIACAFVDFQLLSNLAKANLFHEVAGAIFNALQTDPRVLSLGPPDRTVFSSDAPLRLVQYLRELQLRLGVKRLVVLLDEFSRITDLYLQGQIGADFFQQWRGMLQATGRYCSFVTVVQQKTFDHMIEHMRTHGDDPCWHVLELGETVHLKPLAADDARRLIEWPMRNFLDYGTGVVEEMMRLTGGSPFLIQSFCNKLVARLGHHSVRAVDLQDVGAVAEEFMQPSESIFAHLLDLVHGLGHTVCTQMAFLAEHTNDGCVDWQDVRSALPDIAPATLRSTLNQLCITDILIQPEAEMWRFGNMLFQRWIARNS